jgi:hypothetical protein
VFSLKKQLKKLNFFVEKESQWTNVDDYRPIWMIDIVRDRQLGARWYFSKIHLPQMIISSKADNIPSISADYHPQWLIIILIG